MEASPARSATAIELASLARCDEDGLMYLWYVALFHRPSCFMVESGSPTFAAVVAAPIRKLCPENPEGSMLAEVKAPLRHDTKQLRVSGTPDWN